MLRGRLIVYGCEEKGTVLQFEILWSNDANSNNDVSLSVWRVCKNVIKHWLKFVQFPSPHDVRSIACKATWSNLHPHSTSFTLAAWCQSRIPVAKPSPAPQAGWFCSAIWTAGCCRLPLASAYLFKILGGQVGNLCDVPFACCFAQKEGEVSSKKENWWKLNIQTLKLWIRCQNCRLLKLCTFLVANAVAQSYNSNSQQQSATSNLQGLAGSLVSCSVLQELLWLEVWSVWFWSSDFAHRFFKRICLRVFWVQC